MKIHLRSAKSADAAALADLLTQLGYPARPEQVSARLTNVLPADDGLLIAEVNGAIVGMLHVNRSASIALDDAAEILAFAVDGKWRSQGVGRALLRAAEEWAMRRGCSTLHVRTNVVRERAHEFYFQNGFRRTKTSLTLVKELHSGS